jgi:hypothetical protein
MPGEQLVCLIGGPSGRNERKIVRDKAIAVYKERIWIAGLNYSKIL